MLRFTAKPSLVLLVAGAVVAGTLVFVNAPTPATTPMSFWEAAGRGLVTVVMVNETVNVSGHLFAAPAGILVTSIADVPVVISEEAVLLSPHPSQSPPPNPLDTTADATITNGTVPAHGSLLYSYGSYVLAGYLKTSGPLWWDLEEMQVSQAGVAFTVGGETLPLGLRALVEHPFYKGAGDNTQTAVYAYLESNPTVVVGKLPLWASTGGAAGATVRVRIDATNLAVWGAGGPSGANVNVTEGVVGDVVPAGWSVEEGSLSLPRPQITNNSDGSQTLVWHDNLTAPQVTTGGNHSIPTPYPTATYYYTLVAPALGNGSVTLPRAFSEIHGAAPPDAHSAAVTILGNAPPVADAGGPYAANEGDTVVLNASKSSDADHDLLEYRWSFTDNGTWDTPWSSSPTASIRYTDEFTGNVAVQVRDPYSVVEALAHVTIRNVPPQIQGLTASTGTSADFRLVVAGEKYHDVTLHLVANGQTLAPLRVLRMPGDPANQSLDTGTISLNLSLPVVATVLYTPGDDRVNGQPNGDNPAWLVITFANETSVSLFHNFNVEHEATWNWSLGDLRQDFFKQGVTLRAHLVDPGADPLTAQWDFGDGTNLTQVFPNGPANDTPEPVVGGTSMDVVATVTHAFPLGKSFTVNLTVTDADGASATATIVVQGS